LKDLVIRVIVIIILMYFVSLASGGFVAILYYSEMGFARLPYLLLALNTASAFASLLFIARQYKSGIHLNPVALGFLDVALLLLVLFFPWDGFILPLAALATIRESRSGKGYLAATSLFYVFLMLFLASLAVAGPVYASHHITGEKISDPVDVYGVYRLLPLYTAYKYGIDRVQSPTHTLILEDSYLYYRNKTPIYNWIIEPEGFINALTKKPLGVVFIDGDRYPPRVSVVNRTLKYSLSKLYFKGFYFDSLERQAMLHSMGGKALLHENVEVLYHGKIYVIIPVVRWVRGAVWNLEVPWKYLVFAENGSVREVSFEKALGDPLFHGVPLLPEETAREWARVYAYSVGFTAYYLQHNSYAIRDVGENRQPYLTVTSNGSLYWVFVVEPMGNTYSVKYVIYVPAGTYKPSISIYQPNTTMIGVSKVVSYVKSAHPNYDWNSLKVVEPIPTVIDGRIYWTVKIITNDYRGLVSVDLVDASTSKVLSVKVSSQETMTGEQILREWILGGASHPTAPGGNNTVTSIIKEIKMLKKEINSTIQKLNDLYKKLDELESMIENQTATNTTAGKP